MKKRILILSTQLFICIVCISQTSKEDCPKPNSEFYKYLCSYVDDQDLYEEGDGRYYHYFQFWIEKAACVTMQDPDSTRVKKVQDWWNKYKYNCTCNRSNFSITDGSILKYAVQTSFDPFLSKVIEFYKLGINFIDPADGKTVLDFTKEEYDRLYKLSPNNPKTKSLERIFKLLRANGALYKSELK